MVTSGWTNRLRLWNPYTGQQLLDTIAWGMFGPGRPVVHPVPASEPLAGGTADGRGGGSRVPHAPGRHRADRGLRLHHLQPPPRRSVGGGLNAPRGRADRSGHRVGTGVHPNAGIVSVRPLRAGRITAGQDQHRTSALAGLGRLDRLRPLRIGPPELVPVQAQGEGSRDSARTGRCWRRPPWIMGLWCGAANSPYDILRLAQTDCRHVAVSPDGKLVATGSWHGRRIKVWEVRHRATRSHVAAGVERDNSRVQSRRKVAGRLARAAVAGRRLERGAKSADRKSRVARFSPDSRIVAWARKGFVVLTDAADRARTGAARRPAPGRPQRADVQPATGRSSSARPATASAPACGTCGRSASGWSNSASTGTCLPIRRQRK